MKINFKDLRRLLPGILISLILLLIVFWEADVDALRQELVHVDIRYLIGAQVFFYLSLFARTIAWKNLLEDKADFKRVFFTITEGYFINNVFPFRLGEIGRAFLLSRTTSLRFWQVIPTIAIERAFDMLVVVSIFLASLPFVIGVEGAVEKATLLGIVITVGLVFLYILAHQRERALVFHHQLQTRIPFLRRIAASQIESFFQGLAVLTNAGRFLKTLLWMVVTWGFLITHYYLVLLAFEPNAKILWATFSTSTMMLGIAVPSAPAGLGVVEATLMFALSLFGVSQTKALAYALAAHASSLLLISLPGIYGLLADGESLMQVYRRVRAQASKPKPVS